MSRDDGAMADTERETALLREIQIIGCGFSSEISQHYATLKTKRRTGTLTRQEQAELIVLSDQMEEMNAQRLGYVVQLARLQQMSVDALMDDLGIKSPLYE